VSWLVLAAANGVPSHFNTTALVWELGYAAAGIGAVLLMMPLLVQGLMLADAYRHGLVLGCVVAFGATIVLAGYLSMAGGHWVGGIHSDAGGLPLFGWSRSGGDLRVAHFTPSTRTRRCLSPDGCSRADRCGTAACWCGSSPRAMSPSRC
jgi:hypothetical protein